MLFPRKCCNFIFKFIYKFMFIYLFYKIVPWAQGVPLPLHNSLPSTDFPYSITIVQTFNNTPKSIILIFMCIMITQVQTMAHVSMCYGQDIFNSFVISLYFHCFYQFPRYFVSIRIPCSPSLSTHLIFPSHYCPHIINRRNIVFQ